MSLDDLDLRRSLEADARRVHTTGDFAAAALRRRARTTHRRILTGAALAAAVAVAAPLAWSTRAPAPATVPTSPQVLTTAPQTPPPSLSGTAPSTVVTSDPAPSSPLPAATRDSDTRPRFTVTPAFGPVTADPQVAYAVGGVFHDGTQSLPLPTKGRLDVLARLRGGGVVVREAMDPSATQASARPLLFLDSSGQLVKSVRGEVAPVDAAQDVMVRANREGTRVAVVEPDRTFRLYDQNGTELARLAAQPGPVQLVGFDGGTVLFGSGDEKIVTRAWDPSSGSVRRLPLGNGRIVDISPDRRLALFLPAQEYRPEHTCYGVLDLANDSMRFWSCGQFAPSHFSAEGNLLIGPEVADGMGSSALKVVNVDTGAVMLSIVLDQAIAVDWRGADTDQDVVLGMGDESSSKETLVSCSVVDGTCAVVSPQRQLIAAQRDEMAWPYLFASN